MLRRLGYACRAARGARRVAMSSLTDAIGCSASASSRLSGWKRAEPAQLANASMAKLALGAHAYGSRQNFARRVDLGLAASIAAALTVNAVRSEVKADDRSHELSGEEQRTIELFERCSGAVVHINTFVKQEQLVRGAFGLFKTDMQEIQQGTGSGFMFDTKHIVTNYHVIKGADRATVVFADHTSREAFLVGVAQDFDLAVMRFDKPEELQVKALEKGTSSRLQVGQKVFAIGNPFGLDQTLTSGIVSGLGREMRGTTAAIPFWYVQRLPRT